MYVNLTSTCFVPISSFSSSLFFKFICQLCLHRIVLPVLCVSNAPPASLPRLFWAICVAQMILSRRYTRANVNPNMQVHKLQLQAGFTASAPEDVQLCSGGSIRSAAAPDKHCYFLTDPSWVFAHCIWVSLYHTFGSELGWLCRPSSVHLHTNVIQSHLFQTPFSAVVWSV